jgi:adenosine deaminase
MISECLKRPDDIELIAREFLYGQAAQNIKYTEVTYTAYTIYEHCGIEFAEQLAALNRARDWARRELDTEMRVIVDIAREEAPEVGLAVADWVIGAYGDGVAAIGLGGHEIGNPADKFRDAFERAIQAGIPCILHAGETGGPDSIWRALEVADSRRIGHGIHCLQDPELVDYLRSRQIPLEVCPTSNVCLNLAPSIQEHPIQRLRAEGLYITLNSDDPPMFNTTLTDEYIRCADAFDWDAGTCEGLVRGALRASLLPETDKTRIQTEIDHEIRRLRADVLA